MELTCEWKAGPVNKWRRWRVRPPPLPLEAKMTKIADTPHMEGGSGEQMAKMASKALTPAAGGEDV